MTAFSMFRKLRSSGFLVCAFVLPVAVAGCAASHGNSATASGETARSHAIVRGADGLPVDDKDEMNDQVESWRSTRRYVLKTATRCVSGMLDVYLPGQSVRWARSVRMVMKSPRHVAFHMELRTPTETTNWLDATMFGMRDEEHAAVMRDDSACVATAVAGTSEDAGTTPGPGGGTPGNGGHGTTVTGRTTVTTRTPPTATRTNTHVRVTGNVHATVEVTIPPVTLENPLRGFVDLGNITFDPYGASMRYTKEFVLQREFTRIPMNEVNRSWTTNQALESALVFRIWTQEPMDFGDVTIELQDLLLEPKIPEEEYTRLMTRRRDAASEEQQAFTALCREHPENTRCWFTPQNQRGLVAANRPPPAVREERQPQQPGHDFVWVAGGWQWNGADYLWVPGLWRFVPPATIATAADVARAPAAATVSTTAPTASAGTVASATVQTPGAPRVTANNVSGVTASAVVANGVGPALTTAVAIASPVVPAASATAVFMPMRAPAVPAMRVEAIPPAPQIGAMWIAGYWQWDGRAWQWAAGHWQMPPQVDVRWAPPTVQMSTEGVQVFMPGGWLRFGQ